MKTSLAILAVLAATAGTSTVAFATDIDSLAPAAPTAAGSVPKLYPTEQGAFKALEVATQLVEGSILQKGCYNKEYDIGVSTTGKGNGTAYVDGVNLTIALTGATYEGRRYNVSSPAGKLDDLNVGPVKADGSYNIGSSIQELTTDFTMSSPGNPAAYDDFRGTIIKDYVRLADLTPIPDGFSNAATPYSIVVDYGYQQIQKHKYAALKFWQQSATWRSNGVRGGTWWKKTLVAPGGNVCNIEVKLEGTIGATNRDNKAGFNENGIITVGIAAENDPGEFFKR